MDLNQGNGSSGNDDQTISEKKADPVLLIDRRERRPKAMASLVRALSDPFTLALDSGHDPFQHIDDLCNSGE